MKYVDWISESVMTKDMKQNICVFIFLSGLFALGAVKAADFAMPNEFGPSDFPEDIVEAFSGNPLGGTVTALLGAPHHRASRLQLSFYKSAKETLDLKILVGNLNKISVRYRVFFLVDYKQIKFLIDGKRIWSYEFELPPPAKSRIRLQGLMELLRPENVSAAYQEQTTIAPIRDDRERRTIKVSIPDIGYGAHDVLMVIMSEDTYRPHDEHAVAPSMIAHRFNVYSGSNDFYIVKSNMLDAGGLANIRAPLARLSASTVTGVESATSGSEDIGIELNNAHDGPKRIAISFITPSEDYLCAGIAPVYHTLLRKTAVRITNPEVSRCLTSGATAVVVEEPYSVLENPHGNIVERPMDIVFLTPNTPFR